MPKYVYYSNSVKKDCNLAMMNICAYSIISLHFVTYANTFADIYQNEVIFDTFRMI